MVRIKSDSAYVFYTQHSNTQRYEAAAITYARTPYIMVCLVLVVLELHFIDIEMFSWWWVGRAHPERLPLERTL